MKKKFIKYTLLTIFAIFTNNLFSSEANSKAYTAGPKKFKEAKKAIVFSLKKKVVNKFFEEDSEGAQSELESENDKNIGLYLNLQDSKKTKTKKKGNQDKLNQYNKSWQEYLLAAITLISFFHLIHNNKQNYNNIVPISIFSLLLILNIFFPNNNNNNNNEAGLTELNKLRKSNARFHDNLKLLQENITTLQESIIALNRKIENKPNNPIDPLATDSLNSGAEFLSSHFESGSGSGSESD